MYDGRMKSFTILLLLSLPGSLVTVAGLVEEEPDQEEAAIPIESIHEEVTRKFTKALGFGVSRMIVPNRIMLPEGRTGNHHLSYFLKGYEGYQVNLIGLVNDEQGAVYQSAAELKKKAQKQNPEKENAIALALLTSPKVKPKTTPPTTQDKRAIAHFQVDPGEKPVLMKSGTKWIAHGPIRATEAKCMKCHEVQKGELLGLFRYEFTAAKKD